ncbi:hypothetical protein HPP92_021224 [Vanilla planifolia]|uniref:Uncharacterized protein n=1 Tax=Vanilla planifolia TaxID=51239 RepID=A0A835UJ53_VANPL|nr:hypothetical protein HPP92_021603 [Vanilla planifolia]KAG0462748.1 hypothetical protein HPP92_021224 [Vanilla planifolia]
MESLTLPNRIGLCYIQGNESASTETIIRNDTSIFFALNISLPLITNHKKKMPTLSIETLFEDFLITLSSYSFK